MRLGPGLGADELAITERMDRQLFSREKAIGENQPTERPNTHIIAQLSKDLSDLLHTQSGNSIQASQQRPVLQASPSMDVLPVVKQAAMASTKPAAMEPQFPMPAQANFSLQQMFPQFSGGIQEFAVGPQMAPSQPLLPTQMPNLQAVVNSAEQRRASVEAEAEAAARYQPQTRSPKEVQFLLNSIESREASLRAKVQQLADEKASQQQRLEDQVRDLQRSNAQMELELRRRQRAESDLSNIVVKEPLADVLARPELGNMLREGVITPNGVVQDVSYGRSPAEDRTEQSSVIQDTREDLQVQLAEIRSEVARCASALCGEEPMPTSEVADIRQQLSALSNEVLQTSRALLVAPGLAAQFQGPSRDAELAEVRRQLEALQSQVSRAMYAALSRPGVPSNQERVNAQADELSELRAEVSRLRAEVVRRPDTEQPIGSRAQPEIQELGSQVEALRTELGSFIGGMRSVRPLPRSDPRQPVAREPRPIVEATGLQERLSWLRAEVARVVHDPRQAEDPAHPELRHRLSTLLQELQDLRQGAEVVAATAATSGGSPRSRRIIPGGLVAPVGANTLLEADLRYPQGHSLPAFARARSSTPRRHSGVFPSGYTNALPTVSAAGDWATGTSLRCGPASVVQAPLIGMPTAPPVLVCPHIAAEQAMEPTRYANRYTDRYVDLEHLAADNVTRGGFTGEMGPSLTPSLGRGTSPSAPSIGVASSEAPTLAGHSFFQRAPHSRSYDSPDGHLTPPMVPGLAVATLNGSSARTSVEAPVWGGQSTSLGAHANTAWQSTGPGYMAAEALSAPADEPPEVVPQDNMWRPQRSKLSR